MNYVTLLGLMAGTLTTVAFIPQVLKVVNSRSTKDISLLMFICFSSGVFSWIIYGVLVKDIPVIAANVITFILAIIILVYKIRYK